MKHLITLTWVLLIFCAQAQSFDHILYKQEINPAYEMAIKEKKYAESLQKLEAIKKKYGMLYGEDYRLQSYCYKKIGNDSLAALSLKTCWSVPSFDMRTLFYISELEPGKLMQGFNDYQKGLVKEGFENWAKICPKNADSIFRIFNKLGDEDRLIRDSLQADPDNEEVRSRIEELNSQHEAFLENYISSFGYPGEKQLQLRESEVWVLLLHSSGNEVFYQRMKPIFLEEVRKGNMSPIYFANWVDQHQFYNKLPSVYQSLVYTNKAYVNTEEERKQISKNRYEIGLVDLEFTNNY